MQIKFQSNPSYCQLHCSATKMTSVSETTHTLRYELGRFTSRSQSPPRRYNPQMQDEIISSIQETLGPNNLHQYTGLSFGDTDMQELLISVHTSTGFLT